MHGSAAIVNDVWRGGMPTLGQDQEVSTQLFSHVGPVSCWHVCVSKAEVHGGTPICKVHFRLILRILIRYLRFSFFLFTKVCLVYFTNVMMGESWRGLGLLL